MSPLRTSLAAALALAAGGAALAQGAPPPDPAAEAQYQQQLQAYQAQQDLYAPLRAGADLVRAALSDTRLGPAAKA